MSAAMILAGALVAAGASAQELKHIEKGESKKPVHKETGAAKADGMRYSAGMEKTGEKGPKMATPEVNAEKNDSSKDAHQY